MAKPSGTANARWVSNHLSKERLMATAILSQKALKELLHYDPETGEFTWLVSRGRKAKAGSTAGSLDRHEYQVIGVQGKLYLAHRLAWLYAHGEFPPNDLDHINRVRADNRLQNLRLATRAENMQNISIPSSNTSGHVGVSWYKRGQKWQASITVNYKRIGLGCFPNIEDAIAARKAAEKTYHQFQNEN